MHGFYFWPRFSSSRSVLCLFQPLLKSDTVFEIVLTGWDFRNDQRFLQAGKINLGQRDGGGKITGGLGTCLALSYTERPTFCNLTLTKENFCMFFLVWDHTQQSSGLIPGCTPGSLLVVLVPKEMPGLNPGLLRARQASYPLCFLSHPCIFPCASFLSVAACMHIYLASERQRTTQCLGMLASIPTSWRTLDWLPVVVVVVILFYSALTSYLLWL